MILSSIGDRVTTILLSSHPIVHLLLVSKVAVVSPAIFLCRRVVTYSIYKAQAQIAYHRDRLKSHRFCFCDAIAVAFALKHIFLHIGISETGRDANLEVDGVAIAEAIQRFGETPCKASSYGRALFAFRAKHNRIFVVCDVSASVECHSRVLRIRRNV